MAFLFFPVLVLFPVFFYRFFFLVFAVIALPFFPHKNVAKAFTSLVCRTAEPNRGKRFSVSGLLGIDCDNQSETSVAHSLGNTLCEFKQAGIPCEANLSSRTSRIVAYSSRTMAILFR